MMMVYRKYPFPCVYFQLPDVFFFSGKRCTPLKRLDRRSASEALQLLTGRGHALGYSFIGMDGLQNTAVEVMGS